MGLGYLALLGALAAFGLWRATETVAGDGRLKASANDGRLVAGWLILTASILIPVTIMVLAFPDFNGA